MSENKTVTTKKEKKKLSRSALVLIVGIIIIAIPVLIFIGILGISALHSGTPRDGSRFDGDLNPAITNDNVNQIKSKLEEIGNLDSVEVVLSEGQLRIFLDANDSLSESQIDNIITNAYNTVNSVVPISTYFTAKDSKKMYDLQINVYTVAEESASRQYKLLHKNSAEETYAIDDLAHAKDPKLVAELHGDTSSSTSAETSEAETTETETTETQAQ